MIIVLYFYTHILHLLHVQLVSSMVCGPVLIYSAIKKSFITNRNVQLLLFFSLLIFALERVSPWKLWSTLNSMLEELEILHKSCYLLDILLIVSSYNVIPKPINTIHYYFQCWKFVLYKDLLSWFIHSNCKETFASFGWMSLKKSAATLLFKWVIYIYITPGPSVNDLGYNHPARESRLQVQLDPLLLT